MLRQCAATATLRNRCLYDLIPFASVSAYRQEIEQFLESWTCKTRISEETAKAPVQYLMAVLSAKTVGQQILDL